MDKQRVRERIVEIGIVPVVRAALEEGETAMRAFGFVSSKRLSAGVTCYRDDGRETKSVGNFAR